MEIQILSNIYRVSPRPITIINNVELYFIVSQQSVHLVILKFIRLCPCIVLRNYYYYHSKYFPPALLPQY